MAIDNVYDQPCCAAYLHEQLKSMRPHLARLSAVAQPQSDEWCRIQPACMCAYKTLLYRHNEVVFALHLQVSLSCKQSDYTRSNSKLKQASCDASCSRYKCHKHVLPFTCTRCCLMVTAMMNNMQMATCYRSWLLLNI